MRVLPGPTGWWGECVHISSHRTIWECWRGDTHVSKCPDTAWVPWQTQVFTTMLCVWVDDCPNRGVLPCVCVSGWAGGQGRSWKLSCHLASPFLAYFTLQNNVCLFTGMYSGSSANHNGPSPGVLPPPHDIPSRHHPLDSTLSSPHHHQSPLESAREGYVCETSLASVWHDSERLIVYLGLHECCLNEKHWLKLSNSVCFRII